MSHMPKATQDDGRGYGEPDQVRPYEVDGRRPAPAR